MHGEDLAAALEPLHESGFAWALACCGRDEEMAREILQSTYLKILEGRARFEGRSSVRTWFFGVIRRTAAEHRRRAWLDSARRALGPRDGGAPPSPADPEARLGESERSRAIRRALGTLSRRQRQVLHLVFYEGLTLEESARVLHLSVGSVRVHYERGKARLRTQLPRGEVP